MPKVPKIEVFYRFYYLKRYRNVSYGVMVDEIMPGYENRLSIAIPTF